VDWAITLALVDVARIGPFTKDFVDNLGSLQAFGSCVPSFIVHFKPAHPGLLVIKFSIDGEQAVSFRARKMSSLSTRHLRRAAILGVPIVPVAQVVIHVHHDVLVSDPHPAHLVLRAAFDQLFYLLSVMIAVTPETITWVEIRA
jgi:hypothetical protein